ncbi:MAG: S-layer homology domain-containing protein [Armatimonadetes bacterium]|nr:S-layer homology domain-containing protein [Armatimonadota bacterium]
MNKTLKLAFGALLGSMLVMPALAQGEQFPDVPENHWVYKALLDMKNEGVLVGYPDGLFRGGRPASRYELAGAINTAYQKLKGMIGGLQDQIDAIKAGMGGGQDVEALRRELDALKAQVAAMGRYGDDIAALQRMASTFEKDLAALGVDVEAMKKDLSDLAERVGRLEKIKPAVDIHGDVNAVLHGGHSDDGLFGITVDARPTGVGRGGYSGEPDGMERDLSIGHELGLQLNGTNEDGPKWHATLVVGNLLGFSSEGLDGGPVYTMYGNQSGVMANLAFREQAESVYFQDFGVTFDTAMLGQGFSADLGRVSHKSGRYFFQRIDNTPYFENPRWDDGNWYFDGADLGFHWGTVGLDVYAGRNSDHLDSGSTFGGLINNEIWPMSAGPQNFFASGEMLVDRTLGFDLGFRLGGSGDIMLHYLFLDSDNPVTASMSGASTYNRVNVWGGEVNFNLGQNLNVNGGYSQTDLKYNESTVLDGDNAAWWAQARFNVGAVGIGLGYREIEPWFGAPGDWGRTGFLWNPVDHRGPYGDVSFNVSNNLDAKVGAFLFEGRDGVIIPADAEIFGINAELNFKLFGTWGANLGWEWVEYRDVVAGFQPSVNWYRMGLSQMMGDGSSLMFKYEISNYDDEGSGFTSGLGLIGGDRRGGLFTTQWTRKF